MLQVNEITLRILEAFLSKNEIEQKHLPILIDQVHKAVQNIFSGDAQPEDGLLQCLSCGKKMRSLRRHLKAKHGLTPEEYCEQHGLDIRKLRLTSKK